MLLKAPEKYTVGNALMIEKPPIFSSFLLKVASRCNLNCSYCYMYQHADQTWKDKPRFLSEHHQRLLVRRLADYVDEKKLKRILIIYHGGEPLLFGVDKLLKLSQDIRDQVKFVGCQADFGIQTNGLLLTEEALKKFEALNISVSLSMDGPQKIHDQYRVNHRNKPSFEKVYKALLMLKKFPKIFTGCLSVVNPHFEPRELFQFFDENGITEFNFLLPDAHYIAPPPGRADNPSLYKDWLIKAFDCWFDFFPHVKNKFFEGILLSCLGHKGFSDAFGLGDVGLLNIETDGTYHDLDVLKITEKNSSYLEMGLETHSIADVEKSTKIQAHRILLTKQGLCKTCLSCEHVDICGGGSVPHRFSKEGYLNPTVYCQEMFALIEHAINRFANQLQNEDREVSNQLLQNFDIVQMQEYWDAKTSEVQIQHLKEHLARKSYRKFQSICSYGLKAFPLKAETIKLCRELNFDQIKHVLVRPTVFAWLSALHGHSIGSPVVNIDNQELPADPEYFETVLNLAKTPLNCDFEIQSDDKWFYYSLGSSVQITHEPSRLQQALNSLYEALEIINTYEPFIYREMLKVSQHIQIITDHSNPDNDISFSDETLPGAIFIGVLKGKDLLSPFMLAASLIHEHMHQKLYLLQQRFELFCSQDVLVYSPWPQKLRPPAGALHAVFVFIHVARFWYKVLKSGQIPKIAEKQLEMELDRLKQCVEEIKEKVQFTQTGKLFFDCLLKEYENLVQKTPSKIV